MDKLNNGNGKQNKFSSVQFKLFIILCISTILVTFIIIVINNVVLEGFSTREKVKEAEKISKNINEYYSAPIQLDMDDEFRKLELKENIQIYIENQYGDVEYCNNSETINEINQYKKLKNYSIVYNKENVELKKINNQNSPYLLLISKLNNGYTLYIRIPIMPIQQSVNISNQTLLLIGVMMVIVSACVSSFVAKKFTEPIVQMNRITKKMAHLDFSEKYRINDDNDEINKLGKNINQMSDTLERTITQLRMNNNELEKDIEEKSKIDEMRKQFISDVSHELKTPISLIQGYAEGLIENVNSDEESRKFYANVILDESNKMDEMVKQLLELMKLEYQDRQFDNKEFDLRELIKEIIKRQTMILEENKITVEFDDKDEVVVLADQKYIEQVVVNYFTNAIKHCTEKNNEKKIIIRTEETKENKIRLFVYNTGEKISKDNLTKIWNRFYKVDMSRDREKGGTGIGLAIVKAIMNNYNNKYGVKNYDNGVEFYCDINKK